MDCTKSPLCTNTDGHRGRCNQRKHPLLAIPVAAPVDEGEGGTDVVPMTPPSVADIQPEVGCPTCNQTTPEKVWSDIDQLMVCPQCAEKDEASSLTLSSGKKVYKDTTFDGDDSENDPDEIDEEERTQHIKALTQMVGEKDDEISALKAQIASLKISKGTPVKAKQSKLTDEQVIDIMKERNLLPHDFEVSEDMKIVKEMDAIEQDFERLGLALKMANVINYMNVHPETDEDVAWDIHHELSEAWRSFRKAFKTAFGEGDVDTSRQLITEFKDAHLEKLRSFSQQMKKEKKSTPGKSIIRDAPKGKSVEFYAYWENCTFKGSAKKKKLSEVCKLRGVKFNKDSKEDCIDRCLPFDEEHGTTYEWDGEPGFTSL